MAGRAKPRNVERLGVIVMVRLNTATSAAERAGKLLEPAITNRVCHRIAGNDAIRMVKPLLFGAARPFCAALWPPSPLPVVLPGGIRVFHTSATNVNLGAIFALAQKPVSHLCMTVKLAALFGFATLETGFAFVAHGQNTLRS